MFCLLHDARKFYCQARQDLPGAIVQFASDMPSLVILYLHHPIRQIPQMRGLFQHFIVPLIQFSRSGSNLCFQRFRQPLEFGGALP